MRHPSVVALALALAGLLAAVPAHAGVSELRLGLLDHDVGVFGTRKEDGLDGNLELLFDSPALLQPVWAPRPHLGVTVNSEGDANQLYAGLTWTWNPTSWLFIEGSLGGAIHDGELDEVSREQKALGARVLFRESVSIGWRVDERHSLSVMLDHISNASLAEHNEGLDTLGLRWGYRF